MSEKINYRLLHEKYIKLSTGQKASLKRAKYPEDLLRIGAFYWLLEGILKPENKKQLARVVFMMPFVSSTQDNVSFAERMAQKDIAELRVLQLKKLSFPNDILNLRRIATQMKTAVNWESFGDTLFYWGKTAKNQMLETYIEKHAYIQKAKEGK